MSKKKKSNWTKNIVPVLGVISMIAAGVVTGYMLMDITKHIYYTFNAKFKVGDCIQPNYYKEQWESPDYISRVEEVGKKAYRYTFKSNIPELGWVNGSGKIFFSDNYVKVECPNE